jgi:hypothetical protein
METVFSFEAGSTSVGLFLDLCLTLKMGAICHSELQGVKPQETLVVLLSSNDVDFVTLLH